MKRFLVRRVMSVIPVLLIVSVVIFSLIHLIPGDPAQAMLGDMASAEDVAQLRARMGLDRPLVEQYFVWLANLAHGDFGMSVSNNESVADMLLSHLQPTVSLALYSLLIAVLVAIPLGTLAAQKKGTAVDHAVSVLSLAGISMPGFLLGLLLMLVFAVFVRVFPVAGYKGMEEGFFTHIRYLTLPAPSLGFINAALMMRMTRASMLEVLSADYIRMAKAKGVRAGGLLYRHALRNALISIITVIGQSLIQAFSGAAVIETLFNIPGLGQLMVNSIGRRDYYVIQAIVLLIAVFNVAINLAVDVLYGVADPRVRVS